MHKWSRLILACAVAAMLLPAVSGAQPAQVGNITGVVVDDTGGVLPGVTVTATSQERGFTRSTVTDEQGRFLFPSVPLGSYTLDVTLAGFEPVKLVDNLVESEKTTSVPVTLKVGGLADQITVTGESPIVDVTTTTAKTSVRRDEFDKLPVGRNYQSLINAAPGVVGVTSAGAGTGNVNALGSLSSSNLFLMDGVDTTDPTTGTFGTNLNFESIQEVVVNTSSVSAEYGRATGAVVNIISKSGTNKFEGSFRYLFANDEWNAQNTTKSETTGASLERVKFDKVNPTYTITGGGPIWVNRAWFFATYEYATNTSPQRQTVGPIPEDYQQKTESNFFQTRISGQIANGHNAWMRYHRAPTEGFVVDYWGGFVGQRTALTSQNQGGSAFAIQYNGVLKPNWAVDAMWGTNDSFIDVVPFELSSLNGGAPHESLDDGKVYNGATFDGGVKRPRKQLNLASTWYLGFGGNPHSIKAGFDWQGLESSNDFKYPNGQYFIDESYDQATNTFVPFIRQDYVTGAAVSKGNNYALYVRDKFEIGSRVFAEIGLRWDKQTGKSDIGQSTVDASVLAPRLSGSYDISGDGKTILTGSYGWFYQNIIQDYTDQFSGIPQQTNYDNYVWNGTQYVFESRYEEGASSFKPNLDVTPFRVEEWTLGFQRELSRVMAVAVRYVDRSFANLLDDVRVFDPTNTPIREVTNYDPAERKYRGLEFSFDKRFSSRWNMQASYTYARTEGNQFGATFTDLGNFLGATCRTTADLGIGANGFISCNEVQNGANKYGYPDYDRPHNFKLNGAYVQPFGRFNLTVGAFYTAISKRTYQEQRAVNILLPGTTTPSGQTATYFYDERGNDRIEGLQDQFDLSAEFGVLVWNTLRTSFRAEVFNLFDNQEKTNVNNLNWCTADSTAACTTARTNYGTATARGSFVGPRAFRFSAIVRF